MYKRQIVDEVAEERTDVKVGKVNVDEQPELASQFGVIDVYKRQVLLVLSTAYVFGSTNSPFLYFNF